MILRYLPTTVVLYVHDSLVATGGASTTTPNTSRVVVNWDVATSEWGQVTEGVRAIWSKLTAGTNG